MSENNFWDQYDQSVREEGGGGGIIALCNITTGYKVFPHGVDQADAYFPAPAGSKKAREAAKGRAAKLAGEHNLDRRPDWGIMIRMDKENAFVRGQPATWTTDMFRWAASYTDGCKEVVVPSLKDNGITLPFKGWCRVGVKDDPFAVAKGESGKTDEDQQGNPRFPVVHYVMEVFASKELALEAVGDMPTGGSPEDLPPVPSGYDEEGWEAVEKDIQDLLGKHPTQEDILQLAQDFKVDPSYIQAIAGE
jgi:hypothetical protein